MNLLKSALIFSACLSCVNSFTLFFPETYSRLQGPDEGLRFRSMGPSDSLSVPRVFPEETSDSLLTRLEGMARAQRAVDSRSRQQSTFGHPTRIIFDEDNDEPLAPEPILKIRRRPQSVLPVTPKPSIIKVTSTTLKPSSSKPSAKPTTVLTSTTKRPTTTTLKVPDTATTEGSDCVEIEAGDCDEIFEGSVYAPFRVHRPVK